MSVDGLFSCLVYFLFLVVTVIEIKSLSFAELNCFILALIGASQIDREGTMFC